jgi:hypothetical protein
MGPVVGHSNSFHLVRKQFPTLKLVQSVQNKLEAFKSIHVCPKIALAIAIESITSPSSTSLRATCHQSIQFLFYSLLPNDVA